MKDPVNNDVSANALPSGSQKVEVISGGKSLRYTTKIAAVILLRVIYLFITVACTIQDISDI